MQESDTENSFQGAQECVLLLPLAFSKRQEFLNEEMRQLSRSANYDISKEFKISANNPKYLFSPFRLQEIQFEIRNTPLIIIGSHLSPKQGINLEELFECRVIDKFELVLEIFAERAMTEESKLQIELAQLKYERPRERMRLLHKLGIEGAWHTERTGFWGPGENPLNVFDANMTSKESRLKDRLATLSRQREDRRFSRKRYHPDSLYMSIVGYTSAGKSTILNSLTNSRSSSVSSRLFETLDTRIRSFQLEDLKVFITDTVGFIEDLPTFLIDSFKSTLEESLASDILLIIVDGSEPSEYVIRKARVSIQTLNEINPQNYRVIVLNKIDCLDRKGLEERLDLLRSHFSELPIIPISALEDIQPLITEIAKFRPKQRFKCTYPPNHQFRAFCWDFTHVEHETFENDDWQIVISLRKPKYGIEILRHRARDLGIQLEMEAL
ncbi:MAG: GTPase HflX [Candidatus Heimdallarchaeota archaeon]|nr:MAG: GTPase HflX [Candidatus Heimdallarchaeota archaeon]